MYYLNARYYDPETGRFLNADSVTDGGSKTFGNNLYLYCANNPVNNRDSSGQWLFKTIKNTIKKVVKNVIRPIVKKVQKTLSKRNFTFTTGASASITPGAFSGNFQIGRSFDSKGNVASQITVAGGVSAASSPAISVSFYTMTTNAPEVSKVTGPGYQIGGSANVPIPGAPASVVAGGEVNIIPGPKKDTNYCGITKFAGVGIPSVLGGEAHAEWGETTTLCEYNVFDMADHLYVKIMEW